MRDLAFLAAGMVIGGGLATVFWCEYCAHRIERQMRNWGLGD